MNMRMKNNMKEFIKCISVIVIICLTFSTSIVSSATINETVSVHDLSFISDSVTYDYPVAGTLTVSAAVSGNTDVILIAVVYKRATGELKDISVSPVTILTSSSKDITTKIEVGAGEYLKVHLLNAHNMKPYKLPEIPDDISFESAVTFATCYAEMTDDGIKGDTIHTEVADGNGYDDMLYYYWEPALWNTKYKFRSSNITEDVVGDYTMYVLCGSYTVGDKNKSSGKGAMYMFDADDNYVASIALEPNTVEFADHTYGITETGYKMYKVRLENWKMTKDCVVQFNSATQKGNLIRKFYILKTSDITPEIDSAMMGNYRGNEWKKLEPQTVTVTKTVETDSTTKRKTNYMNFNGEPVYRPYVSEQCWNKEGTKFIFGKDNTLYEYDITTDTAKSLDRARTDGVHLIAEVSSDNKIYYRKPGQGTWCIDWNNYCHTKICDYEFSLISVSNDGKYITGDLIGVSDNHEKLYRYNVHKNTLESISYVFPSINGSAGVNHVQVNPYYPNIMFFCNEGASDIPDRMYTMNWRKKQASNTFVQSKDSNGKALEYFTHEVWGANGEKIYWVSSKGSPTPSTEGLVRANKDGTDREYINRDYQYWHCFPSGNDKWIAGDTASGQVVLVNTSSKKSYYLAKFGMSNWSHPYQPHPAVSYNANSVCWQLDYNGVLSIAWQYTSDITK